MARKTKGDKDATTTTTLRIPQAWLDRADAIAKTLLPGGATRSDALRSAISEGLDRLETRQR